MGWLGSGLTFRVSCLILLWAAGAGAVKVLRQPTCFSDYLSTSTCKWKMDGPINCSAELHLSYLLEFSNLSSKNSTCVSENRDSTVCVCNMLMDDMVFGDTYLLDLWAGRRRLWNGTFSPGEYVKPRAPENLTIQAIAYPTWKLDWTNPYKSKDYLSSMLFYLVNISNEKDPTDFIEYDVRHQNTTLFFPATALKSGVFYIIRVKAQARDYNGTWSEWSPSIRWWNYYKLPWEQHLPLAVSISCIAILVIFLSCYFSILRIKKQWWDQIPNPAHSRLMTIVIQESQVSLWGKRPRGQDPAKCPHWKTCLTKLLPCLLEHGIEKEDSSSKAARNGPLQSPAKSAWHSVEASKTILWPESISVVKRVDLLEAPGESEEEEEEVEEDKESFCPSPKSSGGSFQEGREGIAARLTESLFLDLLGAENGGFCPQGLGESCLLPPLASEGAQIPCAEFPSAGPQAASFQGQEQPLNAESNPPAVWQQSPRCLPFTETTAVIADNPAYRSFSNFLSQSSGPGELDSHPQLAECLGDGDLTVPCAPQPLEPPTSLQPEPETWEQVLRRTVLQHVAASAPAPAPPSGYREFMCAVKQGNSQAGGTVGFGPSGEAGYKSFSGLLARGATCPETPGVEASSGEGGYKPFQSLTPGCPEAPAPTPAPLFTFGLDMELFQSPQKSPLPSSSAEGLTLEPVAEGENDQKPPLPPEEAPDLIRDDLGSGFVYSALTCHVCGQLKQCHGLEERGKAHVVAPPCCGCCCPDGSSPLVSPLRVPDPLPASLVPSGVSEKGKPSLFSQPAQSSAQSSSQNPNGVATLSAGLTAT